MPRQSEVVVEAETVLGERAEEVGKAKGSPGNQYSGPATDRSQSIPPTAAEIMPDLSEALAKKRATRPRRRDHGIDYRLRGFEGLAVPETCFLCGEVAGPFPSFNFGKIIPRS